MADDEIISDPEILWGMPVIKGTRVPVYDLAASASGPGCSIWRARASIRAAIASSDGLSILSRLACTASEAGLSGRSISSRTRRSKFSSIRSAPA